MRTQQVPHVCPLSLSGENMVSKQALQVQEDHEARQRVRGRASSQHQLHLAVLPRLAAALGGLQGRPNAPEQLHEHFWALVSESPPPPSPPSPPGRRHGQASDDVKGLRTLYRLQIMRVWTG